MVFEPTDRKYALGNSVQQIAERAAAFRVAHSGNDFRRLVQQKIDSLFFRTQEPSIYFDMVARLVRLRSHLCHGAPVDGDHSGRDELLRMPPGGNSCARDNFLESFEHEIRT